MSEPHCSINTGALWIPYTRWAVSTTMRAACKRTVIVAKLSLEERRKVMHVIVLVVVALGALVVGFVVGLCITAKRADEAITKAFEEEF